MITSIWYTLNNNLVGDRVTAGTYTIDNLDAGTYTVNVYFILQQVNI